MKRLSKAATEIKPQYHVVVIGSGYGGAIAASRMARAGCTVCLLERGREILPGEYPDTFVEAVEEYQSNTPLGQVGSRSKLYSVQVDEDISVVHGCGLGGTSLINANVSIEMEDRVLEDARWPAPLCGNPQALQEGYRRARQMLRPNPLPQSLPTPKKREALAKSAARLGADCSLLSINVTFEKRINEAGIEQPACTHCGDCVSGCNYGSKNTVLMNYLPDAARHGAEIFTRIDVRHIEREGTSWLIYYQLLDVGRADFNAPTQFVRADVVILAGGSLGSTEILLRSKARGLSVSDRVGRGFSGNGDVLGFAYNADEKVEGVGWGERSSKSGPMVGPCITSGIDLRAGRPLDQAMIIEEGSVPGLLRGILPETLAAASDLLGKDTDSSLVDEMREWSRQTLSLASGGRFGAVQNTQTFLIMTHDDSNGSMRLEDDRLRISWPGVGDQPVFQRANDNLLEASAAVGGTYVRNPAWSKAFHRSLTTVHPLGGCCMADAAEHGVVNHIGQVFANSHGAEVYDTLLVCDGAILPRSVGVNPLLSISALAERNIELFAKSRGLTIDYQLNATPQTDVDVNQKPGVSFTETMKGSIVFGAPDFESVRKQGRTAENYFQFILTIETEDMEAMLSDPDHRASMTGNVIAPQLSPKPLAVSDGRFQLFSANADRALTKQMCYSMTLTTEEGRRYSFEGRKDIRNDSGFDLWSDTTTLYVTLRALDTVAPQDETKGGEAKGVLFIEVADFATQLRTIRALNVRDHTARLKTVARFGQFFLGELYNTYGGIFASSTVHDPNAPPRKRRSLRLPPPEVFPVRTQDGVELRLTRHRAGNKGPVLLAPGMGTSTQAFTLDTIDVNLAEFLAAHGYDVWLFDYRASSALDVSRTQFSLDEIGRYDYPAAVAKVLEVSGAASLQVVAHCVASAGLFVSLLGGFLDRGVRSVIASQFMPHVSTTPLIDVKSKLRLPALLQALGVDVLSTEFNTNAGFAEQVYDALLRLYPAGAGQLCDSPVCRRIRFMWGETFEHANLNHATHLAVHELFGDGNLTLFRQLAAIVRAGRLVDAQERDVYLPHLSRLALPITILQGSKNSLFLPKASLETFEALQHANPNVRYARREFDAYAHMDCFIGKRASADVFPYIVSELEANA